MHLYRVFTLSRDGEVIQAIDLPCASDDDARARVEQLIQPDETCPVELWDGPRLLARFEPGQ